MLLVIHNLNFFALLSLEMMKVCHKQKFFENFRLKKCFELRDLLFGVKIAETHSKSLRITVCVGPAPDWLKKNFEAALVTPLSFACLVKINTNFGGLSRLKV